MKTLKTLKICTNVHQSSVVALQCTYNIKLKLSAIPLPLEIKKVRSLQFSLGTKFLARTRVARFFLVQHIKTGENIPDNHKIYQKALKYTKRPENWQNDHKIYQHLPLQGPPKFTRTVIFGLKKYHLASLVWTPLIRIQSYLRSRFARQRVKMYHITNGLVRFPRKKMVNNFICKVSIFSAKIWLTFMGMYVHMMPFA
jgi:hypothetical protein